MVTCLKFAIFFSLAIYFTATHNYFAGFKLKYLHQVLSEYLVKPVINLTSTQLSYFTFRIMSAQDHLLDLVSDVYPLGEDHF